MELLLNRAAAATLDYPPSGQKALKYLTLLMLVIAVAVGVEFLVISAYVDTEVRSFFQAIVTSGSARHPT